MVWIGACQKQPSPERLALPPLAPHLVAGLAGVVSLHWRLSSDETVRQLSRTGQLLGCSFLRRHRLWLVRQLEWGFSRLLVLELGFPPPRRAGSRGLGFCSRPPCSWKLPLLIRELIVSLFWPPQLVVLSIGLAV